MERHAADGTGTERPSASEFLGGCRQDLSSLLQARGSIPCAYRRPPPLSSPPRSSSSRSSPRSFLVRQQPRFRTSRTNRTIRSDGRVPRRTASATWISTWTSPGRPSNPLWNAMSCAAGPCSFLLPSFSWIRTIHTSSGSRSTSSASPKVERRREGSRRAELRPDIHRVPLRFRSVRMR